MKARALLVAAAALLLTAGESVAAKKASLTYNPVSCIRGGELVLLQLKVEGEGEVRGYFRRLNSTDWCSVEGVNDGPLSRVVLPKFETGDEIEYFFVLLEGRRVVARSPRIYRAKVNGECEVPFARHIQRLQLRCGEDTQGLPSALAAGYTVDPDTIDENPPYSTPDRPDRRRRVVQPTGKQ